ncbi:MAG: hypothetical protein GY930_09425 [bacterium]|nr:hypothetical protein [bacterium]
MNKLGLIAVIVLALAGCWIFLRGLNDSSSAEAETAAQAALARDRASAFFGAKDLNQARVAMAPLIEGPDPAVKDLVRASVIDFHDRAHQDPAPLFERLRGADPESAALHFMLAQMKVENGEYEGALEHYRTVLLSEPNDLASQLGLALMLDDLGEAEEAEQLLRGVAGIGVEHGGAWTVTAVYRLYRMALVAGRKTDEQRYYELYEQLTSLGYKALTPPQRDRGNLAIVQPATPAGIGPKQPGPSPTFRREATILPEFAGAKEFFACDLDGDEDIDFVAVGPNGLLCALREGTEYRVETVFEGPVEHVRVFDLGNDDAMDLLACRGTELLLFEAASGAEILLEGMAGWVPSPLELPRMPAPPADLVLGDIDHEGDLDLLIVGTFGARLLRNDGVAPRRNEKGNILRGTFTDISAKASMPTDVELTWCNTEDLDSDQDVDLLMGGPETVFLMDSLRRDRFQNVAARMLGEGVTMPRKPLAADLDADARPDLLVPDALWRQTADGRLVTEREVPDLPDGAQILATDLDLDGIVDIVWTGTDQGTNGILAFGSADEMAFELAGAEDSDIADAPMIACDFDADSDVDLLRINDEGLVLFRCEGPVGGAIPLALRGLKDNRRAVGAVVELRTQGAYRRTYWRGDAQLVGCGSNPHLDVLRITWPNGAVQTWLDVEPSDGAVFDTKGDVLEQSDSLSGSCPFLYTWNGETYEFISDVLGITPLGLPMAPGVLVPPDHDEHVLVRGDQLVPRNGVLEMQLTEELREVTYLDRVRLDVIDHPTGSEVYPNERFTFPPFPEDRVHGVRTPLVPVKAIGNAGEDWTAALASVDGVHSGPAAPYARQYVGLAAPHWVELHFDPDQTRSTEHLRLLFTGWFLWTDASVNMAAARAAGIDFVPPILQVPGPRGGWVDAGPPIGFPAGKTKTMVIDVSDILDREDPRVRVATTLCLYWDSIRLAIDAGDLPIRRASTEPISARLWSRGFSQPVETERKDLPERFQWDLLTERPRWNQHPGRYTRYGETVALLGEVDDRFVILGSGDALTLQFDVKDLPPLADGWTRDYLVYFDGWAKDRDPNTHEALEVSPLPFHGMGGYPYGADESFPWDEMHHSWDREWNTRQGRGLIPPLSPRREMEWVLR